jgi:hypothetical protein
MTLEKAHNHFKGLLSKTTKKSDIKVYQKFIQIITGLEKKSLTEAEIQSIEKELDTLNLFSTDTNHKRFFDRALKQFKKYLKDTYSFTTQGYYTGIGLVLGSSFGVLFGIVFLSGLERSLDVSLGISIGMLIGLIIGRNMDHQARVSGKMV